MALNRKPPLNVLLYPFTFIDLPDGPNRVPSIFGVSIESNGCCNFDALNSVVNWCFVKNDFEVNFSMYNLILKWFCNTKRFFIPFKWKPKVAKRIHKQF